MEIPGTGRATRAATLLFVCALVAGPAAGASAQSLQPSSLPALAEAAETGQAAAPQGPASAASSGRLIVERIESGFVFAPEVRVTEFDDTTSTLVGGYGGWLTDRTFLIGAGGYWLANGDGKELAYGGAVAEWALRGHRRIGFAVRGLVGAGRASLDTTFPAWPVDVEDVALLFGRFGQRGRMFDRVPRGDNRGFAVRLEDTFLVAEPQVTLIWNATGWMRLNIGAGYRFVGASDWFGDRLSGATGSFSVQFGGDGF